MKSILILTSIYPGPDIPNQSTQVVHYFAKKWLQMGFRIKVIVNSTYFTPLIYKTPRLIKEFVAKHTSAAIPLKRLNQDIDYKVEDISVSRLPMYKTIPMGGFKKKVLDKQVDKIIAKLKSEKFQPDIIIGHWSNPQVYLEAKLGDFYKIRTSLVLHESGDIIKKIPDYKKLLPQITYWGYRSENIRRNFENQFLIKTKFRCYSGIPSSYLDNPISRDGKFSNKYIFVGQLIQRKYPDIAIKALLDVYKSQPFKFTIVGSGPMEDSLKYSVKNDSRIRFTGRVDRNSTIRLMDNADVFIMISKQEVFGLVYIEAMARGCIIIASAGEGMEGIIKSGENGFLCKSGSEKDLIATLNKIRKLSDEQRLSISQKAMLTASSMTDYKVAKDYINIFN